MSTRTLFLYVAALMLTTVSMQANAAARKADCRYWQLDARTPPKSALDGPWGNPTGFALILATTQRDILAYASTPARIDASEEYIQALERMLRRSGHE
jgi:hypothetical protein